MSKPAHIQHMCTTENGTERLKGMNFHINNVDTNSADSLCQFLLPLIMCDNTEFHTN